MSCRLCHHFVASENAHQRAFLEGWGYCNAAPDLMGRAQFFPGTRECWLQPPRYQERGA